MLKIRPFSSNLPIFDDLNVIPFKKFKDNLYDDENCFRRKIKIFTELNYLISPSLLKRYFGEKVILKFIKDNKPTEKEQKAIEKFKFFEKNKLVDKKFNLVIEILNARWEKVDYYFYQIINQTMSF